MAFNQSNTAFVAELDRLLTDRPLSTAAMHPDMADTRFGAVADDLFGITWLRQ